MDFGKCPHCEGTPLTIKIEPVEGTVNDVKRWKLIEYICPLCGKIINVQLDPIAVETETVARIEELLEQKK